MKKSKGFRRPHRFKKRKSLFKRRSFWIAFLAVVGGGAIFYLLIFSSYFQLQNVEISGNQKVLSQDIQNLIWDKTQTEIIFASSQSIFLINARNLKKTIFEEFPAIAKLEIKRILPKGLSVKVEERRQIGAWCDINKCFSLDKEGVIFEENNSKEALALRLAEPEENVLGEKVIENNLLNLILEIQKWHKEKFALEIIESVIASNERLNIKTVEGWEVYFNPSGDTNWQLEKLGLVLEKQISPERRKKLEYIDLRFGDRAYYK